MLIFRAWATCAFTSYYGENVRGQTITAKKMNSMNPHQKTQEYIKGKSPLFILYKKVKIMIFSVILFLKQGLNNNNNNNNLYLYSLFLKNKLQQWKY